MPFFAVHFELYSHNTAGYNDLKQFKKSQRRCAMPRKLTDEEIRAQKDFMYQRTVNLLSTKDLSTVTLDDILDTVQMAKGSFYKYYSSKEAFLYEVIKKNERIYFEKMVQAASEIHRGRETAIDAMRNVLMDKNFLFRYILPEDTEKLLRKLPLEYRKREEQKSQNNFVSFCQAIHIRPNESFFGALSYLITALQTVVTSNGQFGESGQQRATMIIIQAISDLFDEEMDQNGES